MHNGQEQKIFGNLALSAHLQPATSASGTRSWEKMKDGLERETAGLSAESRELLSQIRGEEIPSEVIDDGIPMSSGEGGDVMDWETLPDDEEGSFAYAVRDIISSRWKGRWYKDARTWRLCLEHVQANWAPLLDALTDIYLAWCYPSAPDHPATSDALPLSRLPLSMEMCPDDDDYSFTIEVIDIYTLDTTVRIPRSCESRSQAEAVAAQGYLPTTPIDPTLAISFKTLELFRRLRLRKASFSAEAFAKIPYRRRYRLALSDAFDIYLSIHQKIEKHVQEALGRDTPNWRVLNACPACCYELENEPSLHFGRMYCFDGNNSLKRIAKIGNRRVGDTRTFEDSDYFLSSEFIDQYANEVKSRWDHVAQEDESQIMPDHEVDADNDANLTDSMNVDSATCTCMQNWKSVASEEKKKMWGIFEETGIFASACRHGLILWIADMICSGELAKYPLAMVAKALELLGPRSMGGYDIACSFLITILESCLGPKFQHLRASLCVNAFHGYTHNHACQTKNHPNIIEGMGLEDLETMEHIFSASNQLASIT
ncbi:uncharacterized protein LAESUDRAFT_759386 [Laetiporus sulphureus 93-53]|uniref:CxC1-like cysteine cluster associated with KDZ transposases domain-containing protein n=1 Tax=Laetiporus sulphureus 93-53 TaxID=1314785 RepID=A0A165EA27_9APHY|nr:uncharacterized protein LAESUDRAFT_759386 [Laetiporus sulphureus 93-53]KZT06566.1 hypothetical protein LAESUDRAFT_759386 [Laetiporus sulphureus 93-53]